MITALDKLFEFCASLKLAIVLILSLAFYLAAATFYESAYGTPAVQQVIYDSPGFVLLMALLAINVMAAVVIRYPWKRKQTGFIITHAGIEILLLGCLITHRFSVEGRMTLVSGQSTESMDSIEETLNVDLPDTGGNVHGHVFPVVLWKDAGYPSLLSFAAHGMGTVNAINMPRWPRGHVVNWPLGANAHVEIMDWIPAADPEDAVRPTATGAPAAIVHIGGQMFNGMPIDDHVSLSADGQGIGMTRYQGIIEMVLWKAHSQAELDHFLHPPDPQSLPAQGRLLVLLKGKSYSVDVTPGVLGKATALGESGYKLSLDQYIPASAAPAVPDPSAPDTTMAGSNDPQLYLTLVGPEGTRRYVAHSAAPYLLVHLTGEGETTHSAPGPDDPIFCYDHPDAYFTPKMQGRLHLMVGPDGALYARIFHTKDTPDQKPIPPFPVVIGKEYPQAWLRFSMKIDSFAPSGVIDSGFRAADVDANQLADHMSAMKVALVVDGQRAEQWLVRGGGPVEVQTPRGPVHIDYGFPELELGFALTLDHAEQRNQPMSTQAASWESDVTLTGSGDMDGKQKIVMNEPITVHGYVISQAGFNQTDQGPMSTFGALRDPGWWIKDIGCAGIVGGIFTMFYMKAYFQKSVPPPLPIQAQSGKKKPSGKRPAAASV